MIMLLVAIMHVIRFPLLFLMPLLYLGALLCIEYFMVVYFCPFYAGGKIEQSAHKRVWM